jgi:hypothetical protein
LHARILEAAEQGARIIEQAGQARDGFCRGRAELLDHDAVVAVRPHGRRAALAQILQRQGERQQLGLVVAAGGVRGLRQRVAACRRAR